MLAGALAALDSAARAHPSDTGRLRTAFRSARTAYKRTEWWLAATDSATTAALDGPLGEEGDEADDAEDSAEAVARGVPIVQPVGLQAVEAQLYPSINPSAVGAAVHADLAPARSAIERVRAMSSAVEWTDAAVFDAMRRELGRVNALGLAGVDATRSGDGVRESGAAVDGVCAVLTVYAPALDARSHGTGTALERRCRTVAAGLSAAPDFDTFDRLAFLTAQANPLAHDIAAARSTLGVSVSRARGAWRAASATLFDPSAFDPWAFAPADAPPATAHEVTLGRALFADPTLGGASGRACTSCHVPARAFSDGRPTAIGAMRHTPTLLNVALQAGAFVDLRAATLEDQVADVIANPREMAGQSLDDIAAQLRRRPGIRAQFAGAFGDSMVTPARVRWALAAYERTLVHLDSRFDRAVRGDSPALSPSERRGFTVYMGKARCGTCHFVPLFNGMRPPDFARTEVEVLGVPRTADTVGAAVDRDLGRYVVTHRAQDLHAFRVPTLRNVALTAPYMHNGVYRTLDAVVDFYDRGGGEGIGARLSNQTLPVRPLRLTTNERHDLVAFLRTLTDTTS